MGGSSSAAQDGTAQRKANPARQDSIEEAVKRAANRGGQLSVSGRYHKLPKRIEDDYRINPDRTLGAGVNGYVVSATSRVNEGSKFAVKELRLHGLSKAKQQELENEAEIFLSMDHPHVSRLVDVYHNDKKVHLVMECMEGGELFDRLSERKRFSERDAAHAVWQMLLALNYLHLQGVVHRDLKLENFMYESQDGDHLKLIDFGFSHIWEPNTKMALSCGTLAYVAPEVLAKSYTSQCDLWSLGVVTFILLGGYMPFSGSEEKQVACIQAGTYTIKKERWHGISDAAQDFVKGLMTVNPAARLTAEKALAHPWIAGRDARGHSPSSLDENIVSALQGFGQNTKFRRACLSVMAWSLTNEERAQVRDAFIEMDQTRSGTITMGELKQVLTDKFHVQDEQVKAIFESLDTAHDEEIHYTEFLAAMVSTRIALHDDLLSATFRRFDTDGSGFITADDLKKVLGESFEGTEVQEFMKEADANDDGKISYDEWMRFLMNDDMMCSTLSESVHKLIDDHVETLAKPDSHRLLLPIAARQ